MKKLFLSLSIVAFVISGYLAWTSPAAAETIINKDVTLNTTWTAANSPYTLMKTIEVESTETLTIEPGVTVNMPGGYDSMFVLKGNIIASGTAANPIIFDAGGNSTVINAKNSQAKAKAEFNNVTLKNGAALWQGDFAYLSLKNSVIENFSQRSYFEFPGNDVYIEYNEFKNFSGFSLEKGDAGQIYIRYNRFDTKNPDLASYDDFVIQSKTTFGESPVVMYNSFINIEGAAVALAAGETSAALNAPNNYWGTADTAAIASMVYDKNDNTALAGYITYEPILTAPHADTPGAVTDTVQPPAAEEPTTEEPTTTEPPQTPEINETETPTTAEPNTELADKIAAFITEEKDLTTTIDTALAARLIGRILLQVQNHGEAWYVNPKDQKKYYLANGSEAYRVMRFLSVGITNTDLNKIMNDKTFAKKHSGKIFLQVEARGEAYYIDVDGTAHYLKDGAAAYTIMRNLSLGITNMDVRKIGVGEI
ncbi:MAG: hypothetical protein Q8Q23_01830 [bacterium]|nr:hypothetical protein [bacterium]